MENDLAKQAWDRIAANLNIRIHEQERVETLREPLMEMARRAANRFGIVSAAVVEEALIWWIVAGRLEMAVGKNGRLASGSLEIDSLRRDILPTLEALGKARERYRNAMKELMKEAGESETGGLADIMMPILEEAEGVLEDAIEFEARKKSAAKKRSDQGAQ